MSNITKWNPQQINALRSSVRATNEEFTRFMYLAEKTGLDPFANEIWIIETKNGRKILTSRDGYLKIANNHPAFLGMVSDAIYSNDYFKRTTRNGQEDITHEYELKDRGKLLGAYAKVWRKDRKVPAFFLAPLSDYDKKKGAWLEYPHAMIIKVAESMALKRAFAISGLCTTEELTAPSAKCMRKQFVWSNFKTFFRNDVEKAKNKIFSLVGEKPSAHWTEQDVETLENYLLNQQIIECEVIKE